MLSILLFDFQIFINVIAGKFYHQTARVCHVAYLLTQPYYAEWVKNVELRKLKISQKILKTQIDQASWTINLFKNGIEKISSKPEESTEELKMSREHVINSLERNILSVSMGLENSLTLFKKVEDNIQSIQRAKRVSVTRELNYFNLLFKKARLNEERHLAIARIYSDENKKILS